MSFNNGSMAENFSENDEDYADSTIVEALEVKSGPDGFIIKMRDGNLVKCVHNKPAERGKLPVYAPQPAIVLQLNDGSNLMLPIIVLELPSIMLLEAVRNVNISRPTVYQVMSKMLEVSGYKAKVVRVTKRVNEAYFARVYLVKDGDETTTVSLDIRPSDAINLAVRCNVPIQVNKELALGDGVRVVSEPEKLPSSIVTKNGQVITDMDKALAGDCQDAKEFIIIRNMYIAAVEERFIDAAKLRDELHQFRNNQR